MNKIVSIIVPCFNGERFVDRCLHSIEIQNYPYIEIVVVNDGTADSDLDTLQKYALRRR